MKIQWIGHSCFLIETRGLRILSDPFHEDVPYTFLETPVDIVTVNRLPYKTLSDSYWPDWIDSLKKVETLDFDILVPGHGAVGKKADVAVHRGYLQDLYDGVVAGARAGKSLDELKASLTLDKYKDWGRYKEWRTMNIEGVFQRVQLQRRGN